MSAFLADSLQNLVSSLGSQKSLHEHGRFYKRHQLSRYETDALYSRNWLGHKLVAIPVSDMVREWRRWVASERDAQALEDEEERLGLRAKVEEALTLSAKDGGSAMILGVGDDPALPLDAARLSRGALLYLHVVSRWDLSVGTLDRDPMSPWFKQPTEYRMMTPDGRFVSIHPSRVLLFVTTPRQDPMLTGQPWGDSVYDRVYDAVRDATAGLQASAALAQEAKIDVYQVEGLSAGVRNEAYRTAVLQRFALANTLKSIQNALLLDSKEVFAQKTITFTGWPEMLDRWLAVAAGAADMPLSRLLAKQASGLNSNGEAELANWYNHVRSRQRNELGPILRPLDAILIRSALGRVPRKKIWFEWRELWSVSSEAQSQIDERRARAVEAYAKAGLFTAEALQRGVLGQLAEDGFMPGIAEGVAQFPGVAAQPPSPPANAPSAPE